jgi:hypothetical protein
MESDTKRQIADTPKKEAPSLVPRFVIFALLLIGAYAAYRHGQPQAQTASTAPGSQALHEATFLLTQAATPTLASPLPSHIEVQSQKHLPIIANDKPEPLHTDHVIHRQKSETPSGVWRQIPTHLEDASTVVTQDDPLAKVVVQSGLIDSQ